MFYVYHKSYSYNLEFFNILDWNEPWRMINPRKKRAKLVFSRTLQALDCNFCLTRYCGNPKNSTQSATSSIFQPKQVGVPSESKVGSYPLSNFVGVFRELLISPSAIFVYRGNKPQSHRSPRWKPCYLGGVGGVAAVVLWHFRNCWIPAFWSIRRNGANFIIPENKSR